MTIKINKNDYPMIINRYQSGESSPKIAKDLNVNSTTIVNILLKNNVKIRTTSEASRKYPLIETFFDTIDTQEKAYFLGYLFADGNNSGKKASMNLSEKDKYMLERLNMLVHPKGKPLYIGRKKANRIKGGNKFITKKNYHMVMESKKISEALSRHGCVPRKTSILKYPYDSLEKCLWPHFIRGYFDGDGAISIYGKSKVKNNGYISIVSSINFCESIKNIFQDILQIKSKIRPDRGYAKGSVVELRITNTSHVIKFLNWIYKDSTIHLNRKYETFQDLLKNRVGLSIIKKCCICGNEHYGKGYCNHHYQIYVRKVTALMRAHKSLSDFLIESHTEDIGNYITDLLKDPPSYKVQYRPRTKTES